MARLHIDVGSVPGVTLEVIAPSAAGEVQKVLWFLHDAGGDSSDLLRYTMIETHAQHLPLFIVCPSAGRGSYLDSEPGDRWEARLADAMWEYVHGLLPHASRNPADNMIVGVGAGGYGAIRYALRHPAHFGGAVSLDGRLRRGQTEGASPGQTVDLYALAAELKNGGRSLPAIHLAACARDHDEQVAQAVLRDRLRQLGYSVRWDEPTADRSWPVWDRQVQELIAEFTG